MNLELPKFNVEKHEKQSKEQKDYITFYIPSDCLEKYNEIQRRTEKAFSKHLVEVITKVINKVHAEQIID